MFFFLLSIFSFSFPYIYSYKYGGPNWDFVQNEMADSIEYLENLSIPKTKLLGESPDFENFPADAYPWPGHDRNNNKLTEAQLWSEREKIAQKFQNKIGLKQEDVYRHPVANRQFSADESLFDKEPRVKARITMNPLYSIIHLTGLYVPPGELITIEVPPAAKGRLTFNINPHCKDSGTGINRLPLMRNDWVSLNYEKNYIAWPIGGILCLSLKTINAQTSAIEVIVSGCVKAPFFRYGADTEEEWNENKKAIAPLSMIDTGNMIFFLHSNYARATTNMNEAMWFQRGCSQIMDKTVVTSTDGSIWNRRPYPDGRIKEPLWLFYDSYVPAGSAAAYVDWNFIQFPWDWYSGVGNVDAFFSSSSWGHLHEMGHHHQDGWGIGYTGEVTNNIHIVIVNALMSDWSGQRHLSGNKMIVPDGWGWTSVPLTALTWGNEYSFYANWVHSFGTDKMREFIHADSTNSYYSNAEWGRNEAYLLRACKILKRDFRKYLPKFGHTFSESKVKDVIDGMKLKEYHPITSFYQSGVEVDGAVIETARPWKIPYGMDYTFNFSNYKASIGGLGEFEFAGVEQGEGKLTPGDGTGVYIYTPVKNASKIDSFKILYKDKTLNNEITKLVVQVRQTVSGCQIEYYDGAFAKGTIQDNFKSITNKKPTTTWQTNLGMVCLERDAGSNGFIALMRGLFRPSADGDYTFYMAPNDQGLFYLSDKELSYDPDKDADKLVLADVDGAHKAYNPNNKSEKIPLVGGQVYHFNFVTLKRAGKGSGRVGFTFNDDTAIKDIPFSAIRPFGADFNSDDKTRFVPKFENIIGLATYRYNRNIIHDRSKWVVESYPLPQDENADKITNILDGNSGTHFFSKWLPNNEGSKFPHNYLINMNAEDTIRYFNLVGDTGGACMRGYIEIFCGKKDEVEKEKIKPIYNGHYDSTNMSLLKLPNEATCGPYLKLKIHNNSCPWVSNKKDYPAQDNIIEFNIVDYVGVNYVLPSTNSKIKYSGNWTEERVGLHYNGRGMVGIKGYELSYDFPAGSKQFAIIGDKFDGGGKGELYLDGKKVCDFSAQSIKEDAPHMNTASRRYFALLATTSDYVDDKKEHTLSVKVTDGKIVFSGFLLDKSIYSGKEELLFPDSPIDDGSKKKNKSVNGKVVAGVVVPIILIAAAVAGFFAYKYRHDIKSKYYDFQLYRNQKNLKK